MFLKCKEFRIIDISVNEIFIMYRKKTVIYFSIFQEISHMIYIVLFDIIISFKIAITFVNCILLEKIRNDGTKI